MPSSSPGDLLRIATANQQLVDVAKDLFYAMGRSEDPALAARAEEYITSVLDLNQKISRSLRPSDPDTLTIASANQQIVASTKELAYALAKSTDPGVARMAASHVNSVLDLTNQISAAIR